MIFHPRFEVLRTTELDITLDFDLREVTEVTIPTNFIQVVTCFV
jgi:hypothetical protein